MFQRIQEFLTKRLPMFVFMQSFRVFFLLVFDIQHHVVHSEPVKMSPWCLDVHMHCVHWTDGLLLVRISAVSHIRTVAGKGCKAKT